MPETIQVTREGAGGEVMLTTDAVYFIREDVTGGVYVSPARGVIRFNEEGEVFVTMPGYATLYNDPDSEARLG